MAVEDFYTMQICVLWYIPLVIVTMINANNMIYECLAIILVFVVAEIIGKKLKGIGNADIKLIGLYSLHSVKKAIVCIDVSCLLALVFCMIMKRDKLAFIPFLFIGWLYVTI